MAEKHCNLHKGALGTPMPFLVLAILRSNGITNIFVKSR